MITLAEYKNLNKAEAKETLKNINVKELIKEEREIYYLMAEELSVEMIQSVIQSNYERMVTPLVTFES